LKTFSKKLSFCLKSEAFIKIRKLFENNFRELEAFKINRRLL
jgi:hypothetical protein